MQVPKYYFIGEKCDGDESCCSPLDQCDIGEGVCDIDNDCLGDDLICGINNCGGRGAPSYNCCTCEYSKILAIYAYIILCWAIP